MNDAAVQNHNGAGFNHLDPNAGGNMLDPSAFIGNNASFDPSQFQNQQLQQRMQNGGMRNGSPAFNSPVYQTNPVIPSKRPRPREDSLGTSPHQAPGMLPNSRSQTPQQPPYPGFQSNNIPPQHTPQQSAYSHLQNGSANASPSPIMGNQLRPGGVPQRVSTTSPHPFSPANQQFPPQPSPQSEQGGRIDAAQSNPYAQNPGFVQGFNQNFTPPPGRTPAPPQNAMSTPQMQQSLVQPQQMFPQQQGQPQQPRLNDQQQKMMYQMRLQQQLAQQGMLTAQRQNMPPNVTPLPKTQMQGANGQMGGVRPQSSGQSRATNPDQFMKSLVAYMQSKNLPLDLNPIVGDRQIALVTLYMAVVKFGGYKKITQQNGWPQIAQALQFQPMQNPTAAQQLKGHYERNLLMFDEAFQQNQYLQRQRMMQQQNAATNMGGSGQMSPTKQMNPQVAMQQSYMQQQQLMAQQQHQLQQQHAQSTPVKQMTPMHQAQQPAVNGFSTPQPPQPQHLARPQGHGRNSLSRNIDTGTPQNGNSFTMPSPISATKPSNLPMSSPQVDVGPRPSVPPLPQDFNLPSEFDPKVRLLDTFGGFELDSLNKLGEGIGNLRPDMPSVSEMGVIDIHALTMSIQSGIPAEVRMALDTLAELTKETRLQFILENCEDLVETLVDCAEVQVDFLAENSAEVSDVMLVNSYEDVVRACRIEQEIVQDIPRFGSVEYELDRAVDRLICITTIFRNLTFLDTNNKVLCNEVVIKFICVVIRHLGTRNMLLRTHQNTLDFMKDVVIFLSGVSHEVALPGREQALCLLHFLLAFAPCPLPNVNGPDRVAFSPYDPAVHRYLPAALDSLAKLLARDEPNRTHYKTIFASDIASIPPYDLLTRTFALAISPIPDDRHSKPGTLIPVIEARKPFLMQGLLSADILSNLAPGFESGIARSWLTSEDGFAQNLIRLILAICLETSPQAAHQRAQPIPKGVEDEALLHITLGGISVLRRLGEKCKDPEDPKSTIPISGLPAKETLLGILEIKQPKLQNVIKQLCAYAGLDT